MPQEPGIERRETRDKVTGAARYTGDADGMAEGLHASLVRSPHAHARIVRIDAMAAWALEGVRAVLTGEDVPERMGEEIRDRPPLAVGVARHSGEAVAMVVADSRRVAEAAAQRVRVEYEPMPAALSPADAAQPGAPLVHPDLGSYVRGSEEVLPEPGTNVAHRVRIRKGDAQAAMASCAHVVRLRLRMPIADHVAMETREARACIRPDGRVIVEASTQAPYSVKSQITDCFGVESGKVVVRVPLVGGGFGGKSTVQLEALAYAASRAVGGRAVRIKNSREADFAMSACKEGFEADVALGCDENGKLVALDATYWLDCGAYCDSIPRVARAVAADGTGPYGIPHVRMDALCVYTNHPYATAYRGFGHATATLGIERAMDALADAAGIDPLDFRMRNIILPGDTSATMMKVTRSNAGDAAACMQRLRALCGWDAGIVRASGDHKVRALGLGCFWKAPSSKTNASSGALLTFNDDGSVNLLCAVVECGQGARTMLAQIAAQAMGMRPERVHVYPEIDTHTSPEHWKTVASLSIHLAGNAALRAAQDARQQLTAIAASALHALPDELDIADERVFLREDPDTYIGFADLAFGYVLESGHALGAQVIGRGGYTIQRVSKMDPHSGAGTPAPAWTVGAQAVEIEFDTRDGTYRLLDAYTVIDAGNVLNPRISSGVVRGGMSMGLGLATREGFQFDAQGRLVSGNLRSYKPMHIGEEPRYHVAFVETPQMGAPYGARSIDEHGAIGMPAAVANALSRAAGVSCDELPMTPEMLWRMRERSGRQP